MNTLPPSRDPSDDADEQYRRASQLDPSRPSEATRRAVLAHAGERAAARLRRDAGRRWLFLRGLEPRWRPALVGTVAAAALAAVVLAPQFLAPRAPPESQLAPVAAPAPNAVATATAPAAESPQQEPVRALQESVRALPEPVRPLRPTESASPAAPAPALAVQAQRARVASGVERPALAASDATSGRQLEERSNSGAAAAGAPVGAVARASMPSPAVAPDPAALRHAAEVGDLAGLTAQLAGGSDIDSRDALGRSALMLATLHGQTRAVTALLAHGADPNAADARGTTPLQAAIAADEQQIIATLRSYGAR